MLAHTSNLASSCSLDKQDALDKRVPSLSPWPFISELEKPQEWGDIVRTSSNYLLNIYWRRTFWYPANASNTMHTFRIFDDDKSRNMAQFWAIDTIENVLLTFGLYKSWNIKVTLLNNELKNLESKLQAHGILGSAWTGTNMEKMLTVSSKKKYVDVLLLLIEDVSNREYIEEFTHLGRFLFTYNGLTNTNPNLSHAFDVFVSGQIVTMQF